MPLDSSGFSQTTLLRFQAVPEISSHFEQSILSQIALNRARTPTQRFLAMCELLDAARAMAPADEAARERRRRAMMARQRDREEWHAQCRRFAAAQRRGDTTGISEDPEGIRV